VRGIPAFWLLPALLGTNEKSHGLGHLGNHQVGMGRMIPHETLVLVGLKSPSHDLGLFPREAGDGPRQPGGEGREAVKSEGSGDLGWRIMSYWLSRAQHLAWINKRVVAAKQDDLSPERKRKNKNKTKQGFTIPSQGICGTRVLLCLSTILPFPIIFSREGTQLTIFCSSCICSPLACLVWTNYT